MSADWVAATVRARALAQRRAGSGASAVIARADTLRDGMDLLVGTAYEPQMADATDLAAVERTTDATVLWQLRVLAGWLPATASRLCRAAAGAFERDNITALAAQLGDGRSAPEAFELGALGTAWSSLRTSASTAELAAGLARSPWGAVSNDDAAALRDVLTVVWLRRLSDTAAAARPWALAGAALVASRTVLVDQVEPSPRLRRLLRPLIGSAWERATDLDAMRAALPRATGALLAGIAAPTDLWQAEARAMTAVETDAFRLVRSALPGPDAVLGALAVLATDAWRVRAALASAALGSGHSEVLDAVA
ncbi:hypothetical protein GALL_337750 [mine drainage metagenome]|uniref:Uncharacterized protein n=1 Tax=mine drainage metagenome TaxID=410659 RepID=A0A1J5QLM0_9ZZZZ